MITSQGRQIWATKRSQQLENFSTFMFSVSSAFIVPLVSVLMAQRLSILHEWRQEVRRQLVRVNSDVSEAVQASVDCWTAERSYKEDGSCTPELFQKWETASFRKFKAIAALETNIVSLEMLAPNETMKLAQSLRVFVNDSEHWNEHSTVGSVTLNMGAIVDDAADQSTDSWRKAKKKSIFSWSI